MKEKIQQRILELRKKLGEYDPEPVQLQIDEMRKELDKLVNEHNQEMERVTTLNDELVYWLDVLDKVDELTPSDEEDEEELPEEDLEEEEELNKEELE